MQILKILIENSSTIPFKVIEFFLELLCWGGPDKIYNFTFWTLVKDII